MSETIKAISLWQPWASFMAEGIKRIETRSWPISYRGDLVICAAKRKPQRHEHPDEESYLDALKLPLGVALCIVEVYGCIPTDGAPAKFPISEQEQMVGDYTPGRFGWLTRKLRTLSVPVPVVGRQGLFELPKSLFNFKEIKP